MLVISTVEKAVENNAEDARRDMMERLAAAGTTLVL
jgi:hypothetical protein